MTVHVDPDYSMLETLIKDRVSSARGPLFTVSTPVDLWNAYLLNIGDNCRQQYNCSACRSFIEHYGSLVKVDNNGNAHSLLWSEYSFPALRFEMARKALEDAISAGRINGVFCNVASVWGTPITHGWTHLHGTPSCKLHAATGLHEEYTLLRRSMASFPKEAVVQAMRVLEVAAVDRSEKTIANCRWLRDLYAYTGDVSSRCRDNLCWLAVATAPPGFCHFANSMLGTLLTDIAANVDFVTLQRKWNAKMHPLKYQRPTAISAGNVHAANALVEKLGSANALTRRFAKLEDVLTFLWRPTTMPVAPAAASAKPFDSLLTSISTVKPVILPPRSIRWAEFAVQVLPTARTMEAYIDSEHRSYYGLVTAADASAPPILQWDSEEARNPVSWYFYHGGSVPQAWSLQPYKYVTVTAVFHKPCHWLKPALFQHHKGVTFFALHGAVDMHTGGGGGFFPENLRAEYREVRAAMEAYATTHSVQGREEATANGIALSSKQLRIRVDGSQEYLLTE